MIRNPETPPFPEGSELPIHIVSFRTACQYTEQFKARGSTIVLAQGCFDLFHAGHLEYLTRARDLGDILCVGIENDISIRRNKGLNRPILPLDQRLLVIASLRIVAFTFAFPDHPHYLDDWEPYLNRLAQLQPSVLAASENELHLEKKSQLASQAGVNLAVLPVTISHSTTAIIDQIRHSSNLLE